MWSAPTHEIRAAAAGFWLCLAACSSGPPWTLDRSPDGITLRWYPDNTPTAVADSVAQVHCRSQDRNVELIAYDHDGSAEIGRYRCR
jgi:(2Fe-2S) ferredoxin